MAQLAIWSQGVMHLGCDERMFKSVLGSLLVLRLGEPISRLKIKSVKICVGLSLFVIE